ncbi:TPA: hypothetical protein ACLBZV_005376 [Bacillus cereus]|uniref:hypothetical protein n=1 Tax=Bacillus TaxID=1386 RepID=UPI001BB45218|nr:MULTISPECIES: hypothetical protein [Bacillus]BCD32726.1 hypothetical protein BC30102_p1224 [Bacillus cereus]
MEILFIIAIEILKVIAREVAVFFAKRVGKYLSTSWKKAQKKRRKTKRTTHNVNRTQFVRHLLTIGGAVLLCLENIHLR